MYHYPRKRARCGAAGPDHAENGRIKCNGSYQSRSEDTQASEFHCGNGGGTGSYYRECIQ